MVMGQEERKNKAKLEKTQISLATSNSDYEAAVKALEETTARWNREWKAAADKFQDLEEERLDFTKSSLWTFANIASTVCVSDDSSCEKIRLSLEKMEVEKDIITFISERGTGQEIPDPPKYINFCRGDVDSQSEASEDESYSVAQFPRSINPAFRSSSPQPSTYESHHDPSSALARDLGHQDSGTPRSRETTLTPQKLAVIPPQESQVQSQNQSQRSRQQQAPRGYQAPRPNLEYDPNEFQPVPHDPYPMDGMTMLCRPTASDLSTAPSATSARPSSRDSHSETSFSSQEPPLSPVKHEAPQQTPVGQERKVLKKKSGFFQNHSPFRRKSTKEVAPANRNTWHSASHQSQSQNRQALGPARDRDQQMALPDRTASPDPIAANASLALNVGQNVFPVDTPGRRTKQVAQPAQDDDPIALALAELKGVTSGTKQSTSRMSADHYHGIATPAPGTMRSGPGLVNNSAVAAAMRGTPPPSYDQQVQVQRLGVPPPAVTSRAMKEASSKFQQQTRSMFTERPGSGAAGGYGTQGGSMSRPGTRGSDMPRAASPAPPRSVSPRPGSRADPQHYGSSHSHRSVSPNPQRYGSGHRSASPNPYAGSMRGSVSSHHMAVGPQRGSDQGYNSYRGGSQSDIGRSASPSPYQGRGGEYGGGGGRPSSSMDMAVQLAEDGGSNYDGSQRGRGSRGGGAHSRAMSFYEGGGAVQPASRTRSKSVADPGRGFTRDGRSIMHFGKSV